ncbi:uncharacterized protein LOC116181869 [Photinus pyralis]|uniref:uncharacterized protein LOC116181869 n=1 Tax=Photinus pyralis TaxID=7054 RepID=UPI001266F323|nr:uncharacterized protein LOC116181869 [Photinus pyralis]
MFFFTSNFTLAKSHWKRLRETFKKKLLEMPSKRSGDGVEDDDSEHSDWPYFQSLLFLKDQCLPRQSTGNFDTIETETFEETEVDHVANSTDEFTSEVESQPTTPHSAQISRSSTPLSPSATALPKKMKTQKVGKITDTIGEGLLKAEQEKIAYLKKREENRFKKEMDEDESFFNSLLPYVRVFNPRQKIKFRIAVMKLLEEEIPGPSNRPHSSQSFTPVQHHVYENSQRSIQLLSNEVPPGPSFTSHTLPRSNPVRRVQEKSQQKIQLLNIDVSSVPSPTTPTLLTLQPRYLHENSEQNMQLSNNEISGHTWHTSTSTQSYHDSSERNIIPDNHHQRDISSQQPFSTNNANWDQ